MADNAAAPSLDATEKPPATTTDAVKDGENENDDSNLIVSNYDVAVKLADMQGDPDSPLYSVKRFEDLGL